VPDTNLAELLDLLERDPDITTRRRTRGEGVGVCVGAYLGGKRPALLMQNAGLLNSCNALTTPDFSSNPASLVVYYAGDMWRQCLSHLGLVTEPVLQASASSTACFATPLRCAGIPPRR